MRLIKTGVLLGAGAFATVTVGTAVYFVAALVIRLNAWSHSQQVLFTGCE